jgi:hypothetical protein
VSSNVTPLPTAATPPAQINEDRTALTKEALKHAFLDNLFYIQGKFPALATKTDYYMALAYAVRDRMLQRWISTAATYTRQGSRTVSYLSAEFLMGPHLGNNLINLGIYDNAKAAVAELAEPRGIVGARGRAGLARWPADSQPVLSTRWPRSKCLRSVRHSLRVRHLPAGNRRRLAGGEDRQVAALGQPMGNRSAGMGL